MLLAFKIRTSSANVFREPRYLWSQQGNKNINSTFARWFWYLAYKLKSISVTETIGGRKKGKKLLTWEAVNKSRWKRFELLLLLSRLSSPSQLRAYVSSFKCCEPISPPAEGKILWSTRCILNDGISENKNDFENWIMNLSPAMMNENDDETISKAPTSPTENQWVDYAESLFSFDLSLLNKQHFRTFGFFHI